jgi:hypothetical protein
VAAAVLIQQATLANLDRAMAGPARCKHTIKRAGRFIANPRVTVADAMAGVIARLARCKVAPLVVALDWVEVRNFHALVAAAVVEGRSVPLLWHSYPEWQLNKSQNNLEEGLIRLLRSLVPDRVLRPELHAAENPVAVNVVIRWKQGLPDRRDGPWFLVTDLPKGSAITLTELSGKRMGVEEFFRDATSVRNGLALRHTQVRRADRFDRLVLVLVLAYLLLTGLGLRALREHYAGDWSSPNRGKPCSAVVVARAVLTWFRVSPAAALAAVLDATTNAKPNWG